MSLEITLTSTITPDDELKIAIDTFVLGSAFRNQGSYVYARKVLEGIIECMCPEMKLQLVASRSASSDARWLVTRRNCELIDNAMIDSAKLWRIGIGALSVGRTGADVAYFPAPVNCMFTGIPSVVTVYDATIIAAPSQTWL